METLSSVSGRESGIFIIVIDGSRVRMAGRLRCFDEGGSLKTESDLSSEDLAHAKRPLCRARYLLETVSLASLPKGDVRAGNVK
jgi:hypothetical protein